MRLGALIRNPRPLTVNDDDSVGLALQGMLWADVRHLPVLRDGLLAGIVSDRDLLAHKVRRGQGASSDLVGTMMSRPVIIGHPNMDLAQGTKLVLERRVGCLPILDGRALVGIVTRTDLLRASQPPEEAASGPHENQRRLAEIMRLRPVTAAAEDHLLDAVARMESHGIRHLPVVDGDGRLVGMLSDRDVRAAIGNVLRPLNQRDAVVRIETTKVGDVMSRKPLTISEDATLGAAAASLADHRVGALAVVDEGMALRGIVSYVDLLRAYAG